MHVIPSFFHPSSCAVNVSSASIFLSFFANVCFCLSLSPSHCVTQSFDFSKCVCVYVCLCMCVCSVFQYLGFTEHVWVYICACVCMHMCVCVWGGGCKVGLNGFVWLFFCICVYVYDINPVITVLCRVLLEQVQKLQKQNNKLRMEVEDRHIDSDKLRVCIPYVCLPVAFTALKAYLKIYLS